MNKFFILASFLAFHTLGLAAQAPGDPDDFVFRDLIPLSPSRIITVQQDQPKTGVPLNLYFQALSSGTQPAAEKLVPLKKGNIASLVNGIFAWNGKLNLLTSVYHPGPGRNNYIWQQFDGGKLEEVNAQVIDAVATPYPTATSAYMGYAISPDSSRIGFYTWIYAYAEDSVRLNVQVFNRKMEKEWSRQYKIPFTNNRFLINNCGLRSSGDFFVFAENYKGNIGPEATIKPNRIEHLVLQFRSSLDTARLIRPTLSAKGAFLSSIKFGIAPNEKLYGMGIWQAPRFVTEMGFFILKMDPASDSIQQSAEFLSTKAYQNADRVAKRDTALGKFYESGGFFNYDIQELHFSEDGQIYLLAAQYKSYLVMRFNEETQLQYISIVPRMQAGLYQDVPYNLGFFVSGNTAFLLQTQLIDSYLPPYKLIRIDVNGNLVHSTITSRITSRRPSYFLNVLFCKQINPDVLILSATDQFLGGQFPRTVIFRMEKLSTAFKE